MAYFLGRDVDVFVTLESKVVASGITVGTDIVEFAGNNACTIPSMTNNATVASGAVTDVTGVDLSIGVSDEDVGPFFGQITTHKVELKKETTVSLTRKKSDNTWDVIFNGPSTAGEFNGSAVDATRQGARFGVDFLGTTSSKFYVSPGTTNPKNLLESGSTTLSCYGYRLHVRLKDDTSGEVFTVRNCSLNGHTVSLNADGTTEETLEFGTSMTPIVFTPTGEDTFYTTLTSGAQM